MIASGGLGGEVFIWDIEAALASATKCNDPMDDDDNSNDINVSGNSLPMTSLRNISSSSSISMHTTQSQGYNPIIAKGHKESVYALAMNEGGTLLVSGGTEKVKCGILVHFYVLPCVASASYYPWNIRSIYFILY